MFRALSLSFIIILSLSATADVQKCITIEDDNQRLLCYDSLFRSTEKPAELNGEEKPKQSAEAEKSTANNKTVTLKQSDIFGLEREVENLSMDQLQSRILGKFTEWKKGTKFKLENGQTWQVTSSRTLFHTTNNPVVIIEKGAFGAFYLRFENINRRLKVKRLQ